MLNSGIYSAVTSTTQSRLRTIAPKQTGEKVQSISEYITLYQCNEPYSPILSQPEVETSLSNVKSKTRNNTANFKKNSEKKLAQVPILETIQVQMENSNPSNNPPAIGKDGNLLQTEPTPSERISEENKNRPVESVPQAVTPKAKTLDIQERQSRSTPRSGSHVRQLDFSTPDKWAPLLRHANASPIADKYVDIKENLTKSSKSGLTKTVRTSLFKSPDAEVQMTVASTSTNNISENGKAHSVIFLNFVVLYQ